MKKNKMLCIDLTTYLQSDALLQKDKVYRGELILDGEFDACFVERTRRRGDQRNVRIFDGKYITMTYRLRDGHARFNFKAVYMGNGFDAEAYAAGVKDEILKAHKCLVEDMRG